MSISRARIRLIIRDNANGSRKFVAHEIITHGCRNNKADGTITEPEIYYWDPAPATNDWRKIKSEYSEVCEILYVR